MKTYTVPVYTRFEQNGRVVDRIKDYTVPALSEVEAATRVGFHLYRRGEVYEIRYELIEETT